MKHNETYVSLQHAKEVVSDSLGLVDFAIGLVNSVFNLPDGQAKIFRRIRITNVLNSCELKVAPTKWNLHKQDEVLHYMSDGAHKVKADNYWRKKLVKNFFLASKNDFWAGCWLQLAPRATCKINFLCTLHLSCSWISWLLVLVF